VTDPLGRELTVRRRLLPWRPRRRVGYEPDDSAGLDLGDGLAGLVVGLVLCLVVLPLVLVVGALLLELLLLVVLLPLLLLVRVLARRPWVVEVVHQHRAAYVERVVGWRASGARVAALADDVASGDLPVKLPLAPTGDGTSGVVPGRAGRHRREDTDPALG